MEIKNNTVIIRGRMRRKKCGATGQRTQNSKICRMNKSKECAV
jgi:hypothetical protein